MTFAIAAVCRNKQQLGIAITTSSIAVGSRCPWVRAGVGAVSSQNITDPSIGPEVLDLIESGMSATNAVAQTTRNRPFVEYRQIIAVDASGQIGEFTGKRTLGQHAVARGKDCIAAGNLLANENVPAAMVRVCSESKNANHLADTLLDALEAGIDAGGEEGPTHSATLLVTSRFSWPEVNLRVDWHDSDPFTKLRELWESYQPQMNDYLLRATSPADAPAYGVPGDPGE